MTLSENHSTTVQVNGKEYIYFGGTNYLGLAHRPELMKAAQAAFERYGFSTGASRLTSGENDLMLELEKELAQFAGADGAVVLPAGFLSNQAVVEAIDAKVDIWIVQSHRHGSIMSALAHSNKPRLVHEESAPGKSLREQYSLPAHFTLAVFAEPITPLVGELADLKALCGGLKSSDYLIVDEAHSFGVLGENGKGAREQFNLQELDNHLIRTGTFSKALGSYGGFVLAANEVILQIKQNSTCLRASTSLPAPVCAAALEALRLMQKDRGETIDKLKKNIKMLNEALCDLGLENHGNNCVPIYYLENSQAVARLRDALPSAGIFVPSITSYFAGFCEIGLRWTIQSGHSHNQLQSLIDQIAIHAGKQKSSSF